MGVMVYVLHPDLLKECTFYMLESVYVVKEHRRKGILTRMFKFLKEKAEAGPLTGAIELVV